MSNRHFSATGFWSRLSIKYKIVIISASLITLRIILNGNFYLGYQKLEQYHEFEHHVHDSSIELYNFKSAFTELFFTDGALPQMERSKQLLQQSVATFADLAGHHGNDLMFQSRITELYHRAQQLQTTVEQLLSAPEKLNLDDPEGLIILGKVTAMTNAMFYDVHRLIEDVTVYSGEMRKQTFNSMITMGMMIFSVGILFLIMLYRGVMGPLKLLDEMRSLIQRVRTQGDLSCKLQGESDTEVGRLARDFNELIGALDENLGKTSQTVALVAEHVERLSHEVRESHDEISMQQHEIFHLSNAIRKMAETLQHLAENTHTLSSSISELELHSREGEEQLARLQDVTQRLGEHLEGAKKHLQGLQGAVAGEANSAAMPEIAGVTVSRLQYYSQEAANSIEGAATELTGQRTTLDHNEHTARMVYRLTESIDRCAQKIFATIEQEREMLHTISRDIEEITSLESNAAFTSNLITSASDELLYLSRLLSVEVQRFQTSTPQRAEPQAASQ